MSLQNLTRFPRLEFIGAPTPLEYLPRFSDYLGRDIFIKRDDVTPMAMGGNKLRKLEFLAADALREGADTLITAGAIQSNHVRQTAAVAAKLGLNCVALLENPIGTRAENYLTNGNRLLLDLFNVQIEMCDALTDPAAQLEELATRVEAQGFRPYVIPVGGSNALGALGYVESALEIAQQCEGAVSLSSVVVASGSAGTHAGLAVGLEQLMPDVELIGVTVSRSIADQKPKVVTLQQAVAQRWKCRRSQRFCCGMTILPQATAPRTKKGRRRSNCWRVWKAFCSIRFTPVKRWPGLLTALPRSALRMKGRFCLFIPAERPRCLLIILTFESRVENNNARKYSTGY